MLNYIKSLFAPKEFFPGIIGDGITETSPVYGFKEMVGASAPATFGEPKGIKYPYQFQATSSSCVGFSMAKIVSILYYKATGQMVKFSGGWYYAQRVNKPTEGMWFYDIANLAQKGAVPEYLLPSEGLSEKQMNNLEINDFHYNTADAFSVNDVWVDLPLDFDTVAATIEKTDKPIMVWFKFGKGEFFRQLIPRIVNKLSRDEQPWQHSVDAIDAYTRDGVDYILIEDSADPEQFYQKEITREFFNARCTLARYPRKLKYAKGEKSLYDGTIISAQKALQAEGFFPLNVPFAENVGKVTRESLRKFQSHYGLQITGQLDEATKEVLRNL